MRRNDLFPFSKGMLLLVIFDSISIFLPSFLWPVSHLIFAATIMLLATWVMAQICRCPLLELLNHLERKDWVLLLVSLGCAFFFFIFWPISAQADSHSYYENAQFFVHGEKTYPWPCYPPMTSWWLLALSPWEVFHRKAVDPFYISFVQTIFLALAPWFIYRSLKPFHDRAAWWACVILVLSVPSWNLMGTYIGSEPIFAIFFTFSLIFIARFIERKKRKDLMWAYLTTAAAAFTRSQAHPYILILGIVALWIDRSAWRVILVSTLCYFLSVFTWTNIRDYHWTKSVVFKDSFSMAPSLGFQRFMHNTFYYYSFMTSGDYPYPGFKQGRDPFLGKAYGPAVRNLMANFEDSYKRLNQGKELPEPEIFWRDVFENGRQSLHVVEIALLRTRGPRVTYPLFEKAADETIKTPDYIVAHHYACCATFALTGFPRIPISRNWNEGTATMATLDNTHDDFGYYKMSRLWYPTGFQEACTGLKRLCDIYDLIQPFLLTVIVLLASVLGWWLATSKIAPFLFFVGSTALINVAAVTLFAGPGPRYLRLIDPFVVVAGIFVILTVLVSDWRENLLTKGRYEK